MVWRDTLYLCRCLCMGLPLFLSLSIVRWSGVESGTLETSVWSSSALQLQLNLSPQNSHSLTDAFIFSGNPAEIKVGKNLGLMYHQAGDAGHVKISLPIQGGGVAFLYLRYIVRNTYQGWYCGWWCVWVKSCPAILMWECEMPSMLHRLIMAEDFQRISNKFYTGLASMPEWRVSFWQAKSKFQTMHHHHHHQSPFISEVRLWHIAVTYFVLSEHGNSSIFGQENEAMMTQSYQNLVKKNCKLNI